MKKFLSSFKQYDILSFLGLLSFIMFFTILLTSFINLITNTLFKLSFIIICLMPFLFLWYIYINYTKFFINLTILTSVSLTVILLKQLFRYLGWFSTDITISTIIILMFLGFLRIFIKNFIDIYKDYK